MIQLRLLCLLIISFLCHSCGQHIPSDEEMIDNFNRNEAAFEEIKSIVSAYSSFHYPPFDQDDTIKVALSLVQQERLDTLLKQIGVERVFYFSREDSIQSNHHIIEGISLIYSSWGLSVTGGSKEYIYRPRLKEEMRERAEMLESNPELKKYYFDTIVNTDLKKAAYGHSCDLDLYRPLGNNWYICLSYTN